MSPSAEEMERSRLLVERLIVRMVTPVAEEPSGEVCVAAIEIARRMLQLEGRTVVEAFESLIEVITIMKTSEEMGVVISETEDPS